MDPRPEGFNSATHEVLVLLIISMAQILNQSGNSQTLPMMNILGESFSNVTQTDKVWFMASFPLTSGAFILISGKFGDLYGLKKTLMGGLIWAMIWSLITGLTSYTQSVIFFCICRAMSGIGLAYVLPSAIGIAGSMYPNGPRKSAVFCHIGAMAPVGATMGVVFGALTAQFGHWPWAFYASAICFALLAILSWYVIPDVPRHAPPEVTFDWIGSVVGVVGLVLFNFAWNQAPAVGWDNPYIIVLLIIGVFCLIGFFHIEKRVKYPLIPKEIMNLHIVLILAVIAFGWSSFSIYSFYFFSFLFNINNWSPLSAAASFATFLVFGLTAAFTVNVFISRVRPSYILFGATAAFLIGITMLSTTPPHQSYFHMLFAQMIILSFGMDMSFPAASLVLSDNLPKRHQGMASSLVSTMTNYAMSVSLGMAGTAEGKIFEKTQDLLKSYRAAMYVGVGLASLGCILAIVLHICSYIWPHHNGEDEKSKQENIEA
jgi:DHA2 family multidrug resistance protein-like MFS transporter